MGYVTVGIGGIFGSIARYGLGRLISGKFTSRFPLATFLINISGALLLGILTGLKPPAGIVLLLADGFLGAYTTFSTFMYDGFNLIKDNQKLNAFIYILSSIFLGLIGFTGGFALGKLI